MTDATVPSATKQRRRDIVATLDVAAFEPTAYHDGYYLNAALGAGFDVVDLLSRQRETTASARSRCQRPRQRRQSRRQSLDSGPLARLGLALSSGLVLPSRQ